MSSYALENASYDEWRNKARIQQENLGYKFGGIHSTFWTGDPLSNYTDMYNEIMSLLYGSNIDCKQLHFIPNNYNSGQMKIGQGICSKIVKYFGGTVKIAVIFISVRVKNGTIAKPIFKIKSSNETKFIDTYIRVYPTWEKVISENIFNYQEMCYPSGGIYIGDATTYVFATPPKQTTKRKVFRLVDLLLNVFIILDITLCLTLADNNSSGVSYDTVVNICIGFAALLAFYDICRLSYKIIDIMKHT